MLSLQRTANHCSFVPTRRLGIFSSYSTASAASTASVTSSIILPDNVMKMKKMMMMMMQRNSITCTNLQSCAFSSHSHSNQNLNLNSIHMKRRNYHPISSRFLSTTNTNNSGDNNNEAPNNPIHENNNNNNNNFKETDEEIIQKTNKWIQNIIIGLNLCPFAERTVKKSKLDLSIVRGDDISDIISSVLYECIKRQDNDGTTVVICPDLSPLDFDGTSSSREDDDTLICYLDVVDMLDQVLEDYDLKKDIQIAPFHPLFEFQNSEKDTIDNFTNRSPYPIFHILREEEVAHAVKQLDGDSSKVFQRNIHLLEEMESMLGRKTVEKIIRQGDDTKNVDGLQGLLKRLSNSSE